MSDFKDKMHQIQFPLELRPRPRWGSLQRSPGPLAVFKGATSKGREGRAEEKGKGKGREERGWEHAPIGIFESRRLCHDLQTTSMSLIYKAAFRDYWTTVQV